MALAQILDHARRARARLALQFRATLSHGALLDVFSSQVQALEDAFFGVLAARSIDTAEGEQLDLLGVLVGQPRQEVSDATYRTFLKARIRLTSGGGDVESILAVMRLLLSTYSANAMEMTAAPPAGLILRVVEAMTLPPELALQFLRKASGAGVRLILEWQESATAEIFTLGTEASTTSTGSQVVGQHVLFVADTTGFPATGSIVIDPGGAHEETLAYGFIDAPGGFPTIHFATFGTVTAFAHDDGQTVELLQLDADLGLGDSTDATTGGHLAGASN